jgi:hypothetical protein
VAADFVSLYQHYSLRHGWSKVAVAEEAQGCRLLRRERDLCYHILIDKSRFQMYISVPR